MEIDRLLVVVMMRLVGLTVRFSRGAEARVLSVMPKHDHQDRIFVDLI